MRRQPLVALLHACWLAHATAFSVSTPGSTQMTRTAARAPQPTCRDIEPIADTEAYNKLVDSAKRENRIIVIKFYAGWCRACKAMAPKFERVAEDFPDIEFHEILFEENKCVCAGATLCSVTLSDVCARTRPLPSQEIVQVSGH
jgi:thiol-disulfide isomerase/thioredoxin